MRLILYPLTKLNLVFVMIENDFQIDNLDLLLNPPNNWPTIIFVFNRASGSATPTIGIKAIEIFLEGEIPHLNLSSNFIQRFTQNFFFLIMIIKILLLKMDFIIICQILLIDMNGLIMTILSMIVIGYIIILNK